MQTPEAIAVAVLGLVPGAAYLWSLETVVGGWWLGVVDRIHRFVYWSLVLHLVLAPLTYALWSSYVGRVGPLDRGWVLLPAWGTLWLYLVVPHILGRVVGNAWRAGAPWARHLVGDASPAAWDHVWSTVGAAWVRARLKGGGWVGGVFADPDGRPSSYAAGHPNPQDLWLAVRHGPGRPETGAWLLDQQGKPIISEAGLLIRRDEVEILEITPDLNGAHYG